MFRQMILLLGVVLFIVAFALVVLYLRPSSTLTVHFKEGVVPRELTGEVTKKDKYVVVKPAGGGEEQVFTWEQVANISGNEPAYNKRLSDVTDLLELVAKLGVLAAAGVFLIGLYQFDVGQRWKSEEYTADMVRDFTRSPNVENAKKMIELLKFYPQGRKLRLYPEDTPAEQFVTVENVGRALSSAASSELTDDEMRIRECFDSFFTRLGRFEYYIEAKLTTARSVNIYLSYWINILLGKDTAKGKVPKLKGEYRQWLLGYADEQEFPAVGRLLRRYSGQRFLSRYMEAGKRGATNNPPVAPGAAAPE
jgi:hypothetical protein